MENFVFFAIVGLIASCSFAYAGDLNVDCLQEKQSLEIFREMAMQSAENVPNCWEKCIQPIRDADWSSGEELMSNIRACKEAWDITNMQESFKKCYEADWSCAERFHETIIDVANKIDREEVKKCIKEMRKAAQEWQETEQDTFLELLKNMKVSEQCLNSVNEVITDESQKRGYGKCKKE